MVKMFKTYLKKLAPLFLRTNSIHQTALSNGVSFSSLKSRPNFLIELNNIRYFKILKSNI